ncbi:PIG-P-domain-containing protein, partial [Lenzites betulinus]
PTSPTSPLAPYPPILPTETRSRAPEFYGFVAWAGTYLLFVLYLLWAALPDRAILALGVSWYPNREWALLVPAYGMVLILFTYFTYFALALAGTPAFDDLRTITDSKAHIAPDAAPYRAGAPPEMRDIPLGLVNRVLYGPRPRADPARSRSD